MLIKEDNANANAYAISLMKVLSNHITDENTEKTFSAWCGGFNRVRLSNPDNIFNYDSVQDFVNDVSSAIQARNPKMFTRFQNIINHLATEYATQKIKTSKKVVSSVFTEEINYFPY